MNHRGYKFPIVVLAITLCASLAFTVSLWLLYQAAYDQQSREAARSVETLTNFMEAVAKFDEQHSENDDPSGAWGATMRQIEQGIASNTVAGGDMELIIGQRVGDKIRILHKAERGLGAVIEVPDDGKLATPLHLALQGNKGGGEYLDYRGVPVLAGYAPVPSLGIGVVYKADLDELRAPFYVAAAWAGGILVIMVALFSLGFTVFNRRLANQLGDSERRFSTVIGVVPVGVFETDPAGLCTFVNQRWCEIAGVEAENALGLGWTNALHPDDRERIYQAWQSFVKSADPFEQKFQLLHHDKGTVRVLVRAKAIKDSFGNILGFTGAVTDITSIHLAEQQMLLKDAAIEHALNAIALADLQGKLTYVNPAFLKMWGYATQQDAIGRSAIDFWVAPTNAAEVIGELQQHGQWAGTMDARRANGETFIAELMAVMICDTLGKPLHMLASFIDVTERQRAEDALRDSEERYRSVIATMTEGVVVMQAKGGISSCNAAAEDILGLSVDQMCGRTAMDPRWHAVKEDGSPFPADQHPGTVAINTGESFYEIIMGVDHPLKGRRWISINAHPLLLPDSKTPYGSVATFTDVTEHRNHEIQINASNQVLNAVLDTTPVLIAYLDRDMNFIRVNKAYANEDGKSPNYFPGKNHFSLFPNPENELIFHQVVATGVAHVAEAKPFEYEHNPERGVTHWDWTLTPIKNVSGEVTGAVLSLMNVTEHIEALETAQRSRQELQMLNNSLEQHVAERTRELSEVGDLNRQMIAASSFGISAYRADGSCVFSNAAIGEMIGASHGQVMAQNFLELPSWKKSGITDLAVKTLDSGAPQHQEFFIETSFGRKMWLDIYFAPFQRGGENHLLLIVHDITLRKQTEELVIEAKEAAEKASSAKSEFLSRMSHELRTPMNAILGFSQVLELESIDANAMTYVGEIRAAGDHLLELINDLLDMSRIEAGKMVMAMEPVGVLKATSDAIQIVQSLLMQKGITLSNHCNSQAYVLADATRLRQILLNLLSNAIKYNRDGGRIDIACSMIDNSQIRISVADTGIGIAPEKIHELFTPFERLGAEFSSIDGTGIGLALSKQLVELMGGSIGVTSQTGQGSTFWIEIALALPLKDNVLGRDSHDAQTSSRYSVLYIEDNAANLRLVEAIFHHHSQVRLLTASNGQYGLELAKKYKPDAILLDIHLPDIDGYHVLEELQQNSLTASIPVVALSADAMPIDIEKGFKAGFKHYITKPVRVELLLKALDDVLHEDQDKS